MHFLRESWPLSNIRSRELGGVVGSKYGAFQDPFMRCILRKKNTKRPKLKGTLEEDELPSTEISSRT